MGEKSKKNKNNIISLTYARVIYIFVILFVMYMLYCMADCIWFGNGDFYRKQVSMLSKDSIHVDPRRGNILAHDGRLLASSIPKYKLYADFKADGMCDSIFYDKVDSLALKLSGLYKNKSAKEFKKLLQIGYNSKRRYFLISSKNISYMEYKQAKEFPLFRSTFKVTIDTVKQNGKVQFKDDGTPKVRKSKKRQAAGILVPEERVSRIKPFKSLASRTIGEMYQEKGKGGKCGIEKSFEGILKGTPGIATSKKVFGRKRQINDINPKDGADIYTTIDVNFQDITENALREKMVEVGAAKGIAVLMEVETGKIRSISNLCRLENGSLVENENFFVNSLTEPGSTFKTASMIVALEDGVIDTSKIIDVDNGVWVVAERAKMVDHNARKGLINGKWDYYPYQPDDKQHSSGYGKITFAQSLWYSSNVGISKVIYENYKDKPERFVERLYDMGLAEKIDINIPGGNPPNIKHPKDPNAKWSGVTLPWMSIGYEVQIPPINTITFYNAIANNGKMIKPILVEKIVENGKVLETFETATITKSICSKNTLGKVQQALIDVVDKGTAKAAKSDYFEIAGKTGTAQINYNKRNASKSHQLTFCGYFPANKPKYSCIVMITDINKSIYPSAGNICGSVFKNIAERVYASSRIIEHEEQISETESNIPATKNGRRKELKYVLKKLDIEYDEGEKNTSEWIRSSTEKNSVKIETDTKYVKYMPNVKGMGARDAVYKLENLGLRVYINGCGKVKEQSISSGTEIIKNEVITLTLE